MLEQYVQVSGVCARGGGAISQRRGRGLCGIILVLMSYVNSSVFKLAVLHHLP